MQDFFSNTIIIHAGKSDVVKVLSDPQQLTRWDSEIQLVKPAANATAYVIVRTKAAVNATETLTISHENDAVVYDIQGDQLSYRVQFEFNTDGNTTVVEEHVWIDSNNLKHLPLTLFRPIAKHAFMENLKVLGMVAERWSTDLEDRL